jgi:hypothetical protein
VIADGFAKRAGFAIVDEFYDAAVSGADLIKTRANGYDLASAWPGKPSARSAERKRHTFSGGFTAWGCYFEPTT